MPERPSRRARFEAKFESKLAGYVTPCRLWTGLKFKNGYGQTKSEGKTVYVHILIYTREVGPVPKGKELDHLCPNRHCAEPTHLEPVTHLVNVQRGRAGQLQLSRTHCPRGHPYDESNTHRYLRSGRTSPERICKECRRKYNREYRVVHPTSVS